MYTLAQHLSPDSIYHLSRFAYAELAMAGVTAIGEFHYVHHQLGGHPYEQRTILADSVIQAAKDVGLRINLQRVIYQRAGVNKELEPGQERFCDTQLEDSLQDMDTLRGRHQEHPLVNIGLAVHSVRAVTREWIREASAYAKTHSLPMHMHLSEQRRELEECQAEHNLTPVQLMSEDSILDERFVAVHATHLNNQEIAALGTSQSFVCLCRTTERDLGDGLCDARALHEAGAKLCTGVDSHASSDPFEECRAIELDQRSREEKRTLVADATELLRAASSNGYAALGMAQEDGAEDEVRLHANDPGLVGLSPDRLDDAVVYGASPRAVDQVRVNGTTIVKEGRHHQYDEIRINYEKCLATLYKKL
jgi:formiminoglutamate deiminase